MARETGISFPYNDEYNDNLRTAGTLESSPEGPDVSVRHGDNPNPVKPLRGTVVAEYIGGTSVYLVYSETTYHNVLTGTF